MLFNLALGKENLYILVTNSELYLVFWSVYSIQGTEKIVFTFIVNRSWRYIMLKSLARVMLCMVRVDVP